MHSGFTWLLVLLVLLGDTLCDVPEPDFGNEEYLRLTGKKVAKEVDASMQELLDGMNSVRDATKAYIGAKIKENLFKTLRAIAEQEMESMSMQNRPRQPRQDDEDDDETTTAQGLIPQLSGIVQSLLGNNVNVTKYAENASKLFPRPIGNQIVGVASLLDPNQFASTVATTKRAPITPPPRIVVVDSNGTVLANTSSVNNPPVVVTVTSAPIPVTATGASTTEAGEDEDEDGVRSEEDVEEEEEGRRERQFNFKGINPMKVLDGFEAIWKNINKENATTARAPMSVSKYAGKPAATGSTTESEDGFDDDYTTPKSRVTSAVKGAATQFDALRKGMPDLFQGAREAYKFLQQLNGFLDVWEGRLAATADADDDE